jgi:hypothetical protein
MKNFVFKYSIFWFISFLFVGQSVLCITVKKHPMKNEGLFLETSTRLLEKDKLITSFSALSAAAKLALSYFNSKSSKDSSLTKSELLEEKILPSKNAKKTLEFLADADKYAKNNKLNISFLRDHFCLIKWQGDKKGAERNNLFVPKWPDGGSLSNGKIKLTNYAIFKANGNRIKTKNFPCAIYCMKGGYFESCLKNNLTKRDILKGLLERTPFSSYVEALAWVSRDDLEKALINGTLIVCMPDGVERIFNVYKSNNFEYDRKVADQKNQKKYWYFNELKKFNGKNHLKLASHGGVALAGDIKKLGLGKVILLRYRNPITRDREIRIGVLLDSGSAFDDNLYQLDLFAGIFGDQKHFKSFIKELPNTVEAYLLKKK